MTRYNMSEMMTTAHAMRRTRGITMSEALTKAWAIAKLPKVVDQKTALQEAFKAKYPTGTLKIHQFWRGATVQFTAGGKKYTYRNFGWEEKLGLTA